MKRPCVGPIYKRIDLTSVRKYFAQLVGLYSSNISVAVTGDFGLRGLRCTLTKSGEGEEFIWILNGSLSPFILSHYSNISKFHGVVDILGSSINVFSEWESTHNPNNEVKTDVTFSWGGETKCTGSCGIAGIMAVWSRANTHTTSFMLGSPRIWSED